MSPWPAAKALRYLHEGAGARFDRACVSALAAELAQVHAVAARFPDQPGEEQTREGYSPDL